MTKELEELLLKPIDEITEDDKEILRKEWIINWVGWANIPKWVRAILTKLFFYLDFEIHDINYWKISFIENKKLREEMRKKADYGLLKYSWIWPIKAIDEFFLTGSIFENLLKIEYMIIKFTLSLIPMIFSPLIYMTVRLGWEKAINQTIYDKL